MTFQRSIYYLGNKAKSARTISLYCNEHSRRGDYILDLFAGSGAICRELCKFSAVASNDIQSFSRIICEAILHSNEYDSKMVRDHLSSKIISERVNFLLSHYTEYITCEYEIASRTMDGNSHTEFERLELVTRLFSDARHGDYIVQTHGGVYFTIRDACILQALFDTVTKLPEGQRSIGMASLFYAASKCSVTVGNQFAQPQKFSHSDGRAKVQAGKIYLNTFARNPIEYAISASEIYPAKQRKSDDNLCLQGVDIEIAKATVRNAKLVYLDPPYGREHYSRFYHVLEDMAVGRFTSTGDLKTRMREDRFQSEYSIRSKAPQAFTNIIEVCSEEGAPVAVSYVDESRGSAVSNRIVEIDYIRSLIKGSYSRFIEVPISEKNYSQMNRLNGPDTRKGLEVLLIGSH